MGLVGCRCDSYITISSVMKRKRGLKITPELLAVRKANREIERLLHGDGFHARTKIKKSNKIYSRKRKHREDLG